VGVDAGDYCPGCEYYTGGGYCDDCLAKGVIRELFVYPHIHPKKRKFYRQKNCRDVHGANRHLQTKRSG